MKSHRLFWIALSASILCSLSCERDSLCSRQVVASTVGPTGEVVAEEVREDCGATSATTTVSIRKKGALQAEEDVFQIASWNQVVLTWQDAQTLVVHCADCNQERIEKQDRNWHQVSIRYEFTGSK